ncbi:MAG: DNA repair exonuclease [Oscillospiraceae bacterium]|nr:DNA repair exonuclease [Oscillospiraceae bacterium]
MPKILHCADIHFDSPLTANLPAVLADRRGEELRETFSKIIEYAKNVDILLIAGDLFNSAFVSRETITFLIGKFAQIPDTAVFIAAGNHDFLSPNSYYKTVDFGKNVYVFSEKFEKIEIPRLQTAVFGVSQSQAHHSETLVRELDVNKNYTNIMLLHGEVVSGENSEFHPISREFIENSGMDYVALGHVHKYSGINRAGTTAWAYSGIPEGRGFDELGDKGFIMGEVTNSGVDLEFITCCKRRHYALELEIPSDVLDSEARAQFLVDSVLDVGTNDDLYKISIVGEVPSKYPINLDIIADKLNSALYFAKISDDTIFEYDYDELAKESGVRGLFVKNMRARIYNTEGEERVIAELALKYGLKAMEAG